MSEIVSADSWVSDELQQRIPDRIAENWKY